MFLIQGCFFQQQDTLRVTPNDVLVARDQLVYDMFAGFIWQDELRSTLVGGMWDHYGESNLENIYIGEYFAFTKLYDRREDTIRYDFQQRDAHGGWIGIYEGIAVGKGLARCNLTEVSDDYFNPQELCNRLGLPAHQWGH
jgi:hypothetical protein